MDLDPTLYKELLATFSVEASERAQEVTDNVLKLEAPENHANAKLYFSAIMRALHTIKGSAQSLNLHAIAEMTHTMESVFSQLLEQEKVIKSSEVNVLLSSIDEIKSAINCKLQSNIDTPISKFVNHNILLSMLSNDNSEQSASKSEPKSNSTTQTLKSKTANQTPSPPETLTKHKASPQKKAAEILKVKVEKIDQLSATIDDLVLTKIATNDHYQLLAMTNDIGISLARLAKHLSDKLRSEHDAPLSSISSELTQFIDKVQNVTGSVSTLHNITRNTTSQLNALTDRAHGDIRYLRLVPVQSALRPLERVVRDISHQLGKEINLKTSGGEIEIDRSVLEHLYDPLIHIIRNAADHGLESPIERQQKNKSTTGTISISVRSMGNTIQFDIRDDGQGICPKKLLSSALDKGIISKEQADAMSNEEITDLIFHAGFSSKNTISNISGRGVGLDVVRENLKGLNGNVSIQSQIDKGTCFTLSVPLTLATDRGIIVKCNNSRYAIPTASLNNVIDISPDEIVEIEGAIAFINKGTPVKLISLSKLLGNSSTDYLSTNNQISVVVLNDGWNQCGVVVDEILDEREIVIKPLGYPIISTELVSGGTVASDGEVLMVLNSDALVSSETRYSGYSTALSDSSIVDKKSQSTPSKQPTILVVDDSITTRTLERNILENQGFNVEIAVDGNEAWNKILSTSYDLVITDVEMPNCNGYELAGRIKKHSNFVDLPVIMVSSLSSDEEKLKGLECGADAYIVKGQFETKALIDTVRQFL